MSVTRKKSSSDSIRLLERLHAIGDEVANLNHHIGLRKAIKKDLMSEAIIIAEGLGIDKLPGDGWTMFKSQKTYTKYIPERLAEKGVPLSVIEYAKDQKTRDSWQVRKNKGFEPGEDVDMEEGDEEEDD